MRKIIFNISLVGIYKLPKLFPLSRGKGLAGVSLNEETVKLEKYFNS
jgi:hypothetical protein